MNNGDHTIRGLVVRYNLFEGDPRVVLGDREKGKTPGSNSLWIGNANRAGRISDVQIYGNIFTYAHSSAAKLAEVDHASIRHNTFYGFNPTVQSDAALIWLSNCSHVDIRNNVLVKNINDDHASAYPHRACIKRDDAMTPTLTIDHNLYFAPQPNAWILRSDGGSKEHFRRSQWSVYLETGFDVHSPSPADPLFRNPREGDFRLREGSPAIGAAEPIEGIEEDFSGKPYDGKRPSLGAFEYQGR
jgi:hypothetical protein